MQGQICAPIDTEALEAKGLIRKHRTGRRNRSYELDQAAITALAEPLPVWLPNALIDGAAGEVPPIELIRQSRSLPAMKLLIELYAAQFLPSYGGVPRQLIKVTFERAKIGEQGPFVVWGFRRRHMDGSWELGRPFLTGQRKEYGDGKTYDTGWDAAFWPAVNTLTDLGLIEKVGMLLDGDDPEAEVIHPYGIQGGEPAESEVALAAHRAALAMVTDGQREWAEENDFNHLIPVRRHIANATLIEVLRLKYRPHTTATAAWYALMQQTTSEWLYKYQALLNERATSAA